MGEVQRGGRLFSCIDKLVARYVLYHQQPIAEHKAETQSNVAEAQSEDRCESKKTVPTMETDRAKPNIDLELLQNQILSWSYYNDQKLIGSHSPDRSDTMIQ